MGNSEGEEKNKANVLQKPLLNRSSLPVDELEIKPLHFADHSATDFGQDLVDVLKLISESKRR